MSKKIIVLGAGMVGRAMALDLATRYVVSAVDRDGRALEELESAGITTVKADLSKPKVIQQLVGSADLVVGAVPGFMGFEILKTVLKTGKPVVDISFFPEDALELDTLAREQDVVAIVDAGVAPGMSNLILGYHSRSMNIMDVKCYVGGLPVERKWPFAYQAPFSPIDVIEEYTRPARIKINGEIIIKPALSEPEILEFDEIGTLEAFNTDGLRTLLTTLDIANMSEKTLRYPGHRELMLVFSETGFFNSEPLEADGIQVAPRDVTARLLVDSWKQIPGEPEFTVMRIIIQGEQDGQSRRIQYDLLDRYDTTTGTTSMARTTGYACTAMADLVLQGMFTETGIHPPEHLGAASGCFDTVMSYLSDRNIHYQATETGP